MKVTLAKVSFLALIAMFGASDAFAHGCEKVLGKWLKDPKIAEDDCHKDKKVENRFQKIESCIKEEIPTEKEAENAKETGYAKDVYDACKVATVADVCEYGDNLSKCAKESVRQVYVNNDHGDESDQGTQQNVKCYGQVDAKMEAGLLQYFDYAKKWNGSLDPAPAVFRSLSACKKAKSDLRTYKKCLNRQMGDQENCMGDVRGKAYLACVEKEKRKPIQHPGDLESEFIAVSYCEGTDGGISQIKFHFPSKKDRIAFKKDISEYQDEEAKKAELKKTSAAPIVETNPMPPAQEVK